MALVPEFIEALLAAKVITDAAAYREVARKFLTDHPSEYAPSAEEATIAERVGEQPDKCQGCQSPLGWGTGCGHTWQAGLLLCGGAGEGGDEPLQLKCPECLPKCGICHSRFCEDCQPKTCWECGSSACAKCSTSGGLCQRCY